MAKDENIACYKRLHLGALTKEEAVAQNATKKKDFKVLKQYQIYNGGGNNMAECVGDCNLVSKCDIFDFMARFVGLTIVHPGGYNATQQLLNTLELSKDSIVLDIACGKGTSATYIAKKYDCKVTAIDISADLIEEAKHLARRKGLSDRVNFMVGDAMELPFEDNSFDVAVSQAMLVLVDDKVKTIKEAKRVVKSGGTAGWLELSWRNEPTKEFIEHVSKVLCSYCMNKAETYDGWKMTFQKAGIPNVNVQEYSFMNGGFAEMLKDEGLLNTIKVFHKYITNENVRRRMRLIDSTIKEYSTYFGYGVYSFRK
jgi:ubiquinone/menaquinone biosynthesis C-methylase UbiE